MLIRATRPYRGHADAGPKGVSWGSAIRTRTSSFKGYRATWLPRSPLEPFPRVELGHRRYRGRTDAGPKGTVRSATVRSTTVRSAGLEPALSTSSSWPLYRWSTSAWSRHPVPTRITGLTKARPQPCVTAPSCGSSAAGAGLEPTLRGSGPRGLPISRPGIAYGRRDSNAHRPFGLPALRMACLPFHHFHIVRHQGFEPRTSSLRGCCSDH